MNTIGRWAFIGGAIIAVILGFFSFPFASLVLVILGLVVGFLNIQAKETHNYLVGVIALLLIGFSGLQIFAIMSTGIFDWIQTVLTSFVTFVAASGLVVAFKVVVKMGED